MNQDIVLCIDAQPLEHSQLWAVLGDVLPPTLAPHYATTEDDAIAVLQQSQISKSRLPLVCCAHTIPVPLAIKLFQQCGEFYPDVSNILMVADAAPEQLASLQANDGIYRCLRCPWAREDLQFTITAVVRQDQLQQELHRSQVAHQALEEKLGDESKEHQQTRRQAQVHRLRLEHLLQNLEQVVWSMSPETMTLKGLSAATATLYGRSEQSFFSYPQLWLDVVHPEDQSCVAQARQDLRHKGAIKLDYRMIRPNGETRWLRDTGYVVTDGQGKPLCIDGIITDVTREQRAKEKHEYDTLHDDLTGLPNRSFLTTKLNHALTRTSKLPEQKFAVLLMDLDRFNVINDGLGYHMGDQVLVAIANQLREHVRKNDCVARLEGDEFTLLLDNVTDTTEVNHIAERILTSLSTEINVGGQAVFLSASMGIVVQSEDYHDGGSMLRDAAIAMNRAKSLGKARHIFFNPSMHSQTVQRMQLESDLRLACNREEFVIHYQPIISLKTRELKGFEALVRWSHLNHGMISPAEFIPVAEETGLIVKLGKWVLENACHHLAQLQQDFDHARDLRMSVNLASLQLQDPQLLDHIDRILAKTQLQGASLKLELTESMLMQHQKELIATMKAIRERGIELSLDDFGTGYSSLSYLNRFPINTLKVDRSFVTRMRTDVQDLEIVRTIITLAHTLGMDVIAEGIETEQQARVLKHLGCEYAQGYLFSPPLDFDSVQHRLRTSHHSLSV